MKDTLKDAVDRLPIVPGVYIFKDHSGEVLYVGKSVRLRDRVRSYFSNLNSLGPRTSQLVAQIDSIEHVATESEIEALLLEAEYIKQYQPPFNSQGKDDKSFQYIKVQNAAFRQRHGIRRVIKEQRWPWVSTTRDRKDDDALYFGPYPAGGTVRKLLRTLRKIFPWCRYRSRAQWQRNQKPCFNSQIDLCPGICTEQIDLKEYWQIIDRLTQFLQGKKKSILNQFTQKMQQAAQKQDFETATHYRDLIQRMEYVTQGFHDSADYLQNPNLREDLRVEEIERLFRIINLRVPANPLDVRIEGYDISNLGRENTVGSRVVFIGGDPVKSLYRRYRIQHETTPDDYAAMQEVIHRRFKRDESRPTLVLIDGGKGQLAKVMETLVAMGLLIPCVGLAKQHETLIVKRKSAFEEIQIPRDDPALKLIQRIRDEAHRFALHYHRLLQARLKK